MPKKSNGGKSKKPPKLQVVKPSERPIVEKLETPPKLSTQNPSTIRITPPRLPDPIIIKPSELLKSEPVKITIPPRQHAHSKQESIPARKGLTLFEIIATHIIAFCLGAAFGNLF